MGQGQYDLASVAVKADVHACQHDKGVLQRSGQGSVLPLSAFDVVGRGDLAHQLGTGELVGLAPHLPTSEGVNWWLCTRLPVHGRTP